MAYGVSKFPPYYGVGAYNGFSEIFDVNTNQWYQSPSVFSDTMDTTTNWIADESTGGTASTISSVNGELKVVNTGATYGAARTSFTTVAGKKYTLKASNTSYSGASGVWIHIGSSIRAYDILQGNYFSGSTSIAFTAISTTTHIILTNSNTSGAISTWDNVAIYPINNDGSVDTSSATPIAESRNYLDAIVYADAGGQPTYVEQLPKIEYKRDMEVDTLKVLSGFDLNQLHYNKTTVRFLGATYTNTSGKPKYVKVLSSNNTAGALLTLYVNGVTADSVSESVIAYRCSVSTLVMPNETYSVSWASGTGTLVTWIETE